MDEWISGNNEKFSSNILANLILRSALAKEGTPLYYLTITRLSRWINSSSSQ